MVEGFSNLVKVRRRQDAGVAEVRAKYPELFENDHSAHLTKRQVIALALRHPLAFAVYASVSFAVKTRRPGRDWTRGR